MSKTYHVSGMKCDGCAKTVQEKLAAVKGVESAQVDLNKNQVTIEGNPWKLSLKRALKDTKSQLGSQV